MFIEERCMVGSWSSILQGVHPAIPTSHRSVVCDSIIWVVEMRLETLASFLKIKAEHVSCWITVSLLHHHLVIPAEAPTVHDAVITHSHIDHLGMAPWLCAHHRTRLHGTVITAELSDMMWRDCYKVSSIERYPLAWDKRDIDTALDSWYVHDFGVPWKHHGWELTLHPAGHIPGAAMLHITTPETTVLLTGDFDTRDSSLVNGAQPVKTDILFVEGTYGGRDHPPKQEEIDRFISSVEAVVNRGGTVLIPAFANGRTQDVVMMLHQYLPRLNVHVDGMGKRVAKTHMNHPKLLRDSIALERAWRWAKQVSSKSDRKKALAADVIVTTSGMLEGGPALWYLNRLRHDQKKCNLLHWISGEGYGWPKPSGNGNHQHLRTTGPCFPRHGAILIFNARRASRNP